MCCPGLPSPAPGRHTWEGRGLGPSSQRQGLATPTAGGGAAVSRKAPAQGMPQRAEPCIAERQAHRPRLAPLGARVNLHGLAGAAGRRPSGSSRPRPCPGRAAPGDTQGSAVLGLTLTLLNGGWHPVLEVVPGHLLQVSLRVAWLGRAAAGFSPRLSDPKWHSSPRHPPRVVPTHSDTC